MCFLNMCKNVRKSNLCETGGVCVYYLCRLLCCLIIDKIILTPFLKELCFRILTFFNSMTKNSQKKKQISIPFILVLCLFFAGKNHGIILNRYSYIFIFNFQSVYRTSDIY